jgi:hypothetical protein
MAIVTNLSSTNLGSYLGQEVFWIEKEFLKNIFHTSSAINGAKGYNIKINFSNTDFGIYFISSEFQVKIFKHSIIALIAVLNPKFDISSSTFLIVLLIIISNLLVSTFLLFFLIFLSKYTSYIFQILSKNLTTPVKLLVFHGLESVNPPINISYNLKASTPYSLTTSSGLTTFPKDLDIFSPLAPNTIPWLINFINGSTLLTYPKS